MYEALSRPPWLWFAFVGSVVGLLGSLAVYGASLAKWSIPTYAMALHIWAFVVFVPVICAIKCWGIREGFAARPSVREQWRMQRAMGYLLPAWQRWLVGIACAFALANFAWGFSRIRGGEMTQFSYTLFAGHWSFFYLIISLYARRFLSPDLDGIDTAA